MSPFSLVYSTGATTLHCSPETTDIPTTSGTINGIPTSQLHDLASNIHPGIAEFTKKYCPAVLTGFKPSWWLPNGHAQTAYCVMGDFSKVDHVEYERKYLRLPDGGTLGVDFTPPFSKELDPSTPIIVVEHGLTGGSHESYVRHILAAACASKESGGLGYRAAVINFRGCAGVPLTSPRLYSAACTDDLACGTLYISRLLPKAKLVGLGFSLGANVITRYLGEEGVNSRLSGGCVLACPWNLVANSASLESNWFNREVYSKAMGANLMRLYRSHLDNIEKMTGSRMLSIHSQILKLKSPRLLDVDELMVSQSGGAAPHWPFASAQDYYRYASSDQHLPGVKVPLLAISAQDDPIVRIVPKPDETSTEASGWVAVAVTPGGGHLGWFEDGEQRGEIRRWIKLPVLQWIQAVAEEFKRNEAQGGRETEVVDGFTREVGRENIGYKEVDEKDLPKGPNVKGLTKGL